jgi:hypothetical protein
MMREQAAHGCGLPRAEPASSRLAPLAPSRGDVADNAGDAAALPALAFPSKYSLYEYSRLHP